MTTRKKNRETGRAKGELGRDWTPLPLLLAQRGRRVWGERGGVVRPTLRAKAPSRGRAAGLRGAAGQDGGAAGLSGSRRAGGEGARCSHEEASAEGGHACRGVAWGQGDLWGQSTGITTRWGDTEMAGPTPSPQDPHPEPPVCTSPSPPTPRKSLPRTAEATGRWRLSRSPVDTTTAGGESQSPASPRQRGEALGKAGPRFTP